ncbi:MAG: RluA family pseudouridine synthase [Chloroflexi bacterium]|nr:RluA family pseudouridine synthase [Chloroflexota bacterium]MCY3697105.1 RluA family pseudouridine synthase [Chloroflexota bacterium]MXX31007.1 RluA family pseudouridine synthase [Chloroflexota bacterium]MYD16302.1 RluA family pseudouridine synthase [Chloroflexota bacterium]MYJ00907.1 RluA family pseudouridine synthase [Chloroflexota bacterium]
MTDQPSPALELMADQAGERLDQFLARRLDGASRSQARHLIVDGLVQVDSRLERPAYKLNTGELVTVHPRQSGPVEDPVEIELSVVYEDDHLAVIDKQASLTVHPAPGETQPTLIAAIINRWPEIASIAADDPEADPLRPGLVHRLDRDTTGLLMIAKTADALRSMRDQLRDRTVDKRYLAVVVGAPDPPAGLIDAAIGRDPADPRRMAILDRGRPSQTGYETTERFTDAALVTCKLITGRTHQIRVHLSAIGHPIAGDSMYGMATPLIDRQALHASHLTIRHPATDDPLTVTADPPADFRSLLGHLREGELLLGDQPVKRSRNEPADSVKRQARSARRQRRRRSQRIR